MLKEELVTEAFMGGNDDTYGYMLGLEVYANYLLQPGKEINRNFVNTNMIMNKLFDANDAYCGAKDEMLKYEHIGKKLKMKIFVKAHYLIR